MIQKLSFKEYRAKEAFSYSIAKRILENPNKWALGYDKKRTQALDFGSLAHDMVLSPAELDNKYLFCDFEKLDMRNKECKELKAEADAKDLILIDKNTHNLALDCISANGEVLNRYLNDMQGDCEVSAFSEIDGANVKCRADFLSHDENLIIDLKFVADATKDGFAQSVAKFGYHIQNALYCDIFGAERFLFIAIEKEPPFLCGIYELAPEFVDLGREKYKKALEMYKNRAKYECQNYADLDLIFNTKNEIQTITPPTWAFYRD